MKLFIDSILYSYAQIFFSNKRYSGAILLLATFLDPIIGLGGLLGVISFNLIGVLLKFDLNRIRSGFYGFNGILIGAGLLYYFNYSDKLFISILLFIIIGFFISAAVENYLAVNFNLPGLSLPFIITIFIFLIFSLNFGDLQKATHSFYVYDFLQKLPDLIKYYFLSLGIIFFQSNIISGVIVFIAILLFSRIHIISSIIAYLTAYYLFPVFISVHNENLFLIALFNSILTGIALGGSLILPSKKSILLIIFSSVIILVITSFFGILLYKFSLPVLVLPFNFVVLSALYSLKFRQDHSDLVLLYFSPASPEENYYYHTDRKSRFSNMNYTVIELPILGEWYISQGNNGEYTHKDKWKEALDFVVVDSKNKEYENDGNKLTDYYCFNLPVIAPADGIVTKISNHIENNEIGKNNLIDNWGNTVVVKINDMLYYSISHLSTDSVKVKPGDFVKKGDILAACGNSGRSPYPHIHFQFQNNDKIGSETLKQNFSYFIETQSGETKLQINSIPKEKSLVKNLDEHKGLMKAFNFQLGDKYYLNAELNGISFTENWEVKVDIYNNMYIESSAKSFLYFFNHGKIFVATGFVGEKKSALYYFYLNTLLIPKIKESNISWEESLPLSKIITNYATHIAGIFLYFKQLLTAKVKYNFDYNIENDLITINSDIKISGELFFKYFKKVFNSSLSIESDGKFRNMNFTQNNKLLFSANFIYETE